jgi:hypothetical protein
MQRPSGQRASAAHNANTVVEIDAHAIEHIDPHDVVKHDPGCDETALRSPCSYANRHRSGATGAYATCVDLGCFMNSISVESQHFGLYPYNYL